MLDGAQHTQLYACGMVRKGRGGFPRQLYFERYERGTANYLSNGELFAQSWIDSKEVYFLSTIDRAQHPVDIPEANRSVRRRSILSFSAGIERGRWQLLAVTNNSLVCCALGGPLGGLFYFAHLHLYLLIATLPLCISSCRFELRIPIERHWLGMHIIIFSLNGAIPLSAFEITLVRLSETSNNLPGQAISPVAVIRRTSDMRGKNSATGRKFCIRRLFIHMLGVLIAVNIVPVQPF